MARRLEAAALMGRARRVAVRARAAAATGLVRAAEGRMAAVWAAARAATPAASRW